jgi:hypothetical protein
MSSNGKRKEASTEDAEADAGGDHRSMKVRVHGYG